MIYVVELSFPTQSRSPPEYITKRSLRFSEDSFFVKLPELRRREVRQEHVAGSGGEAIVGAVKRLSNVVKQ